MTLPKMWNNKLSVSEHFRCIRILCIKNIRVELRCWIHSSIEIVMVLILTLMTVLYHLDDRAHVPLTDEIRNLTQFSPVLSLDNMDVLSKSTGSTRDQLRFGLVYSPEHKYAEDLTRKVADAFGIRFVDALASQDVHFDPFVMLAGITLHSIDNFENNLTVTLKFPSEFRTLKSITLRDNNWESRCNGNFSAEEIYYEEDQLTPIYIREGFLQLQHQLFLEWFKMRQIIIAENTGMVSNIELPEMELRYFVQARNSGVCTHSMRSILLPYFIYFQYFYPMVNLIWRFAQEREEEIFVHHVHYGCNYWHHWFSHFLIGFCHFCILHIIVTLISKTMESSVSVAFKNVSFFTLFLYLNLYSLALITFGMVVVSACIRVRTSILSVTFMWLGIVVLYSYLISHLDKLSNLWVLTAMLLFFNNTFAMGVQVLRSPTSSTKDYWIVFVGLIVNTIVHLVLLPIITLYKPGRYVQLRWNRIPESSHSVASRRIPKHTNSADDESEEEEFYKEDAVVLKEIYLPKDQKYYKEDTAKFSASFYKGEIVILYGPNGSGKTTLLTGIAGWHRPPSGQILINGKNVYEQWHKARQYIDICMPHNCLFPFLNVKESLNYFITIKQKYEDEEKNIVEMYKWLEYLRPMIQDTSVLVKYLSYDQRRLLFLCCALCNDTQVLILDEPTLQMRWRERQLYWHIVKHEKQDRCIIIGTNSLEEAETVGDRIAMMHEGALLACGSPFFLRGNFGLGYDLIILLEPWAEVNVITRFLANYVPNIKPENTNGDQLLYKVPANKTPIFQLMLIQLEKRKRDLGVKTASLFGSDLSEVFSALSIHKSKQTLPQTGLSIRPVFLKDHALDRQQWLAIIEKKIIRQKPTKKYFILLLISALVIIFFAMITNELNVPIDYGEPLHFGLEPSGGTFLMNKIKDCELVVIKKQDGINFHNGLVQSDTFTEESLRCINDYMDYREYMTTQTSVRKNIGGVARMMNPNKLSALYNERLFNSAPITLNLMHNMALQFSDETNKTQVSIISSPQEMQMVERIFILTYQAAHLIIPNTLAVCLPLLSSFFAIQLSQERSRRILMLFEIAGLKKLLYWSATLFLDVLMFMGYALIIVILSDWKNIRMYTMFARAKIFLVLVHYSIPSLLLSYIISMLDHANKMDVFWLSCVIRSLTGYILFLVHWDFSEEFTIMYFIINCVPDFAVLNMATVIYSEMMQMKECHKKCQIISGCNDENMCDIIPVCCNLPSTFSMDANGIGIIAIILTVDIPILVIVIAYIERKSYSKRFFRTIKQRPKYRSATYAYDDAEVVAIKNEMAEADLCLMKRYYFAVDQMESHMPKKKKDLDTISFKLDKGDCLVIYGPRRSGKSHMCRQLIGEDPMYFGDIFIKSIDFRYFPHEAYKIMGYCPQGPCLYDELTPAEIIQIFCLIRGLLRNEIGNILHNMVSMLDMHEFMHTKTKDLNSYQKRKVNIALSFVVANEVIILDEPSSGLNALARRQICNVLRYARSCKKTLIVTTVDKLECEAVAGKVMLFEDGEMMGYQGLEHLRQKFTVGFYVELKLRSDGATVEDKRRNFRKDVDNLHRFFNFLHESSEIRFKNENYFKFYCPVKNLGYAYVYGSIEKNKRRLNIQSYAVTQGNMEDILQNIATIRTHKK